MVRMVARLLLFRTSEFSAGPFTVVARRLRGATAVPGNSRGSVPDTDRCGQHCTTLGITFCSLKRYSSSISRPTAWSARRNSA